MSTLNVLKDVEEFLRKDLAGEVLSTRTKTKRTNLIGKVAECITKENEQNKLDDFLARQREVSRVRSSDSERSKSYGQAQSDDEDDGDYYMDLTEISATPGFYPSNLSPPVTESCGSGSGYESYASDEETSVRPKSSKEEDLSDYFSSNECDVFTYIYIENKNKFLKGKKWLKRIAIVKENHLKFYKKPSDSSAVLDIPLRAYNTALKNREGTTWIAIILSTTDGEAHRFYVERDKIDEWSKVLREKTLSCVDDANLPPPPVAARPASTLPRSATSATNGGVHSAIQRTSSLGVTERTKSLGDFSIFVTDCSAPPVPPGHPSLSQQNAPNNKGKGLKSAVTDMFKKDKTKKRILTAETLGADVCGYLMVFDQKWMKKWCLVNRNQLLIYGKGEAPELQIELQGCNLLPYSDDPERQFGFKIRKDGKEVVYMEASSSSEMGKWVGILIAETGCAEMPEPESEPTYMPIDVRKSVMSTAKQAFDNRKESLNTKNTGRSTFFQDEAEEDEEEDIYLDLDAGGQIATQNFSPQKIIPPPLPPTGRISKSHSVPSVTPIKLDNEKPGKANKSTPTTSETSEDTKKTKTKQKKREKNVRRHLTEPSIKSPTESKPSRDIRVIREPLSPDGAEDNAAKTDGCKSIVDGIIEKRKKELMTQKADIKTKLLTLSVKKDELGKYIQASSNDKERGRLRYMLQKATDDYTKLEKEEMSLEVELRKLKDRSYIESPANKRPPSRKERKPISTGATGNVMARAQMWESANQK